MENNSRVQPIYPGRVALQQRVLPGYRIPFFDALANACQGGLDVFAGEPRSEEAIKTGTHPRQAKFTLARNRHLFSVNHPLYLCWQEGLVNWLEKWDPDVLVVEANPRYPATPRGIRWMHARRRPVVGWGLGAPPLTGPLAAIRKRSRLRLIHSFDALIAYSQRGAREYRDLGYPSERISIASNAAAPRPMGPPPPRLPGFSGPPRLLFVGRLQARKRVDLLLQACATLPPDLQPELCIVGDGPARDELRSLARRIYPRAEFPGAQHGTNLASLFARADLFVLPGTGGLAVQEAMAAGLPVLVAEGDGTQEDLVRPENGWLIPPDDLPSLTTALRTALSDASRLRRMGAESYRIVQQEANIDAMVAVFVEVFKQVSSPR